MKSKKTEIRKLGYDRPQALFAPASISIRNPISVDGLWGYVMKKDVEIKQSSPDSEPYMSK